MSSYRKKIKVVSPKAGESSKVRHCSEILHIDAVHATWVTLIFDHAYYARQDTECPTDSDAAFYHFLKHGLDAGYTPGPLFDREYCRKCLGQSNGELSVFKHWIKNADSLPAPTPLFNAAYYLQTYPDVRESGINPFGHFLTYGQSWQEGRSPNAWLAPLVALWRKRSHAGERLSDIFSSYPQDFTLTQAIFQDLEKFFQPLFYTKIAGLEKAISSFEAFIHYMTKGVCMGLRPTCLFHEGFYQSRIAEKKSIPLPHTGENIFLHWYIYGMPHEIIPTPLYDDDFYIKNNKDLRKWSKWRFLHYAFHGINEDRIASPLFDPAFYKKQKGDAPARCALLDYLLEGEGCGKSPSPFIGEKILSLFLKDKKLQYESGLECLAALYSAKFDRLNTPKMRELIEHVASIEPLVLKSAGSGLCQYPPLVHEGMALADAGGALSRSLPFTTVDNLLLLPHCRMGGAARVAGHLFKGLRHIFPDEKTIIVLTDKSLFQRPDYFGDGVELIDLPSFGTPLSPHGSIRLLLDLIRGLSPKRVINANSRLGWECYRYFARQLREECALYACLWTWDLDEQGNKTGYPGAFFQSCFGSLKGVIFDNPILANEIIYNYTLPSSWRHKLHPLHMPVEIHPFSQAKTFESRRARRAKPRCFWCGRFDRQKRFDILIEIARQLPDVEFQVWGEPVLRDFTMPGKLPENIHRHAAYQHFDDLPYESCDFLLYTSQWDGLPNTLLDAGTRGIAIVASRVGGIGSLLSEETGWPVDDFLNPEAYVTAIQAMCATPKEVTRRAKSLQHHVHEWHNWHRYCEELTTVFSEISI